MADAPKLSTPLSDDIPAMAFVQSSFLCQGVPDDLLGQLYDTGQVLAFEAGSVVFEEGETDDCLYVVIDGSINVRKSVGDADVELASLDRQAVFGEIAVLMGRPRVATAVARIDARLVRFTGEVVRGVAEKVPKFGRKLAALMAGRIRDTDAKLGA